MTTILKPDICVIGAGSGGLTVAATAAMFGTPVVLIEKGRMGGDCLNYGCVPSKALIAAGKLAQSMRLAEKFGIAPAEPEIDFRKVAQHVQSVIAEIAPNDSVERFTALGVHVIRAAARFTDSRTVAAGDFEIRARRFVVATGSSPLVPPIPGLDEVEFLTNETVFALTKRPAHLAIIGGGPIGCELAQAFRRLGSEVTVVEGAQALAREDPELAAVALRRLRAEGVSLREGSKVTRVEKRGKAGLRLHLERDGGTDSVDATHLLLAVGRRPNVEGLGLEAARIRFDRGGVKVSARLRSSNRRVYAVGDVAGGPQFTHVAGYHGGLVVRPLLFRLPARTRPEIIPRVTYVDPEIAQVGMTEAEARKAGHKVTILRWPYSENDRAQAEHKTEGLVKLVAGKGGRVLGAGIAGHNAGEMINLWALAAAKGLTLRDMTAYVPPYPTMTEIGKRAAIAYYSGAVRRPLVRWLVRFLRRFG